MKPVNRSLTLRIRQALYALKKEYGAGFDIYKLLTTETDVQTGQKTITKEKYRIRRGPVLPVKVNRTVQQSISLISSNKEFVTGGTYDAGTRDFLVDRRDCPDLPTLTADDWIVYNGGKYQIKNFEEFEVEAGWIITATKLIGEIPEQIFNANVHQCLTFVSDATAEVE